MWRRPGASSNRCRRPSRPQPGNTASRGESSPSRSLSPLARSTPCLGVYRFPQGAPRGRSADPVCRPERQTGRGAAPCRAQDRPPRGPDIDRDEGRHDPRRHLRQSRLPGKVAAPRCPEDLPKFDGITFKGFAKLTWRYQRDGKPIVAEPRSRFASNSTGAAIKAAVQGVGIARGCRRFRLPSSFARGRSCRSWRSTPVRPSRSA